VAIAYFWRTFHHDGKIALAGEGGGVHALPTPFHSSYPHVQSCSVRYAPAERADTLTLFYPYRYTVGAQSIARLCQTQNLINCRRNI
jgi:hypothetical protein